MDRPTGRPAGRAQRVKTDGPARPVGVQDLRFVRRAAPRRGHPHDSPLSSFGAAPSQRCALRPPIFPPIAQKQSSRPITGRPWCDSKWVDHLGGLIPGVESRVANACGDLVSLRGATSTLRHFSLRKHRQRCGGLVTRTGRRKPGAEIQFCSQRRPLRRAPALLTTHSRSEFGLRHLRAGALLHKKEHTPSLANLCPA